VTSDGPGAGVEFLMRTLDLAETLLRAASDSRDPEHADFCRSAARDFAAYVTRLLPSVKPAEEGHDEVVVAAARLEAALAELPA